MAINIDELCGCNPKKLASRTIEENLEECSICGFNGHCTYPRETVLKMAKSATEDESTENLQDIARSSHDFADFHEKATRKRDRLCREPETEQKNLRDIAQGSMTFSDYHEKAVENDKKLPPPKIQNKNLQTIARSSMTFSDFHEQAKDE